MEKEKIKELVIEHKERFLSKKGLIIRDVQREIREIYPAEGDSYNHGCKEKRKIVSYEADLRRLA